MRKAILFMMVSLDGYFEGPGHDLSWHNVDKEFNIFAAKNLNDAGALLFGRRTYELMEGFWPNHEPETDDAGDATITDKMNNLPKFVFSRTFKAVHQSKNWKNITLVKDNAAAEIKKLKKQDGKDMLVLASSNLCITLLEEGLLDELQIMINPVAIGKGIALFGGIKGKFAFKLIKTRIFKSGNILAFYTPLAKA